LWCPRAQQNCAPQDKRTPPKPKQSTELPRVCPAGAPPKSAGSSIRSPRSTGRELQNGFGASVQTYSPRMKSRKPAPLLLEKIHYGYHQTVEFSAHNRKAFFSCSPRASLMGSLTMDKGGPPPAISGPAEADQVTRLFHIGLLRMVERDPRLLEKRSGSPWSRIVRSQAQGDHAPGCLGTNVNTPSSPWPVAEQGSLRPTTQPGRSASGVVEDVAYLPTTAPTYLERILSGCLRVLSHRQGKRSRGHKRGTAPAETTCP